MSEGGEEREGGGRRDGGEGGEAGEGWRGNIPVNLACN